MRIFAAFLIVFAFGCPIDDRGVVPVPDAEPARVDASGEVDADAPLPPVDAATEPDPDARPVLPDADGVPTRTSTFVEGNPTCEDFDLVGVKIDPAEAGTYETDTGDVTVATDGYFADWDSTFEVSSVIVKASAGAIYWEYSDPVLSDIQIHGPSSHEGGLHPIGHLIFCF